MLKWLCSILSLPCFHHVFVTIRILTYCKDKCINLQLIQIDILCSLGKHVFFFFLVLYYFVKQRHFSPFLPVPAPSFLPPHCVLLSSYLIHLLCTSGSYKLVHNNTPIYIHLSLHLACRRCGECLGA